MKEIIVAFARQENVERIRSLLVRSGMDVTRVCTSGAQVLAAAVEAGRTVVISCFRLRDMSCFELRDSLPPETDILLLAPPEALPDVPLPEGIVFLPSPLKARELLNTLYLMTGGSAGSAGAFSIPPAARPAPGPARPAASKQTIDRAKAVLMERHHMTEPEAHHYLQKCAMDTGTKLLEMAEMVLLMENRET